MRFIGIRDLSNKASECVRAARENGPVIITKHGKPQAVLVRLDSEHSTDDIETFTISLVPGRGFSVTGSRLDDPVPEKEDCIQVSSKSKPMGETA